jgi:group II intron reverse transcriptase/maturase
MERMMQTSLHVIANAARRDRRKRFRSLYSLFNRVLLKEAFRKLNRKSVSGVDEVTWEEYESNLEANLIDLEERLKQKRYWPRYVKRVYIPKPNGKKRPLGILVLEDKIVQQLASDILMALFEPLFLDCSYAYRPKRSAKQAVRDLREEIQKKYVWVVESDISGYFDHIDHSWLLRMIEKRVNDRAFIGLISRFLKSGIRLPDGTVEYPEYGTPQGGIVSPVLSNIYLHYVLDLWFEKKVKTQGRGQALLIRYADDFVAAFRYHGDAARFYRDLSPRFATFNLELAKEKTRKLQFNRFKKNQSETFVFLGYEFRQTVSWKRKNDIVSTVMCRKKLHRIVDAFSDWCKKHRHRRIAWIMGMVKTKLNGIRNYFNLPGNYRRMKEVKLLFQRKLIFWLNRRSERKSYSWKTFFIMWKQFLEKRSRSLANEGVQISFLSSLV